MVYYEPAKITINVSRIAKVIIDAVLRHHGLLDLIITNKSSFFNSKFWLSLCYFFGIKRWLFTAFYPQIDGQTKMQNNTIKVYLWAFINFELNN